MFGNTYLAKSIYEKEVFELDLYIFYSYCFLLLHPELALFASMHLAGIYIGFSCSFSGIPTISNKGFFLPFLLC